NTTTIHEISTLSLHDALPIFQSNTTPEDKIQVIGNYNFLYVYNRRQSASRYSYQEPVASISDKIRQEFLQDMETQLPKVVVVKRSEEHTSELQSRFDLVCRLL